VDAKTVESLLREHFEPQDDGVIIAVDGAGANYDITVVSDLFGEQRAVKRQQAVYGALREAIASGSIHAVNIQALTPAEAEARGA
jgi:acid stress-induced BolA-like protein IbaG/YrbA